MKLTCATGTAPGNRQAELDRTLGAASQPDSWPDEIVLRADGCTDGTAEFVRNRHPGVRPFVQEASGGPTVCRDILIQVVRGDILVSLDLSQFHAVCCNRTQDQERKGWKVR